MATIIDRFVRRWWFSLLMVTILVAVVFFVTPIEPVLSRYYAYLPISFK
ncbi:hypothetical protein [Herpetosiphon sp. NSE202]